MKDLGDMSKMPLTHYISSHLSVLYSTVVPILLMVSFHSNPNPMIGVQACIYKLVNTSLYKVTVVTSVVKLILLVLIY